MNDIIKNIVNLFISPRFVSFYWRSGAMISVSFLDLIAENLAGVGLPVWAVAFIGLSIGEATKALNNFIKGKQMGFSKK